MALNVSSGTVAADGAVGIAVFQYNKDLLKGKSAASASVGFQSTAHSAVNDIDTKSQSRRLLSADPGVSLDLALPNLKSVEYFETTPKVGIIDCLRTGVPHNITVYCPDLESVEVPYLFYCPGLYGQRYNFTCPFYTVTAFCTSWDGEQFLPDSSCEVISREADTTTCRCTNAQSDGRRLASAEFALKQFSSTAYPVPTPFVQLITHVGAKDSPAVDYDFVVVILMSAFVGLSLIALFVLFRHDHAHLSTLFKRAGKEPVSAVAHAVPPPAGSSAVLALNYSFPLYDESARSQKVSGASDRQHHDDSAHTSRHMRYISVDNFFNAVLPKELTGQPWHKRLSEKFLAEHDWYSLFQKQVQAPRGPLPLVAQAMLKKTESWAHTGSQHELKSLRWLLIAGRLLNFLFFTTLLVSSFYSDDGTCEDQILQEDCLDQKGIFNIGHTCTWEPNLESACQFNKLSFDNPLSLLLVAVVVTVISLPFDHLFYFVIVKLKLSTTDVAIAHMKAVNAKTHRQVEPLRVKAAGHDAHAGGLGVKGNKKVNSVQVHPRGPAMPVRAENHDMVVHTHGAHAGTGFYARHHELSGMVHRQGLYLRAARLLLIQTKTDRVSARKEVHALLNDIHTGAIRLRVQPSKILTLHMIYMRLQRSVTGAAMRAVDFVRGRALAPTEFRENVDEDTIQYVSDEVKYGRHHAKAIKRTMGSLSSDLDKEAFLIQQFLVECLPPMHRRLASLYLFRKVELSKIGLSNYALYALFALLMLYLAFAVVYIFVVGTTIGSRASMQWLLVIGICFAHDLFFLQPVKIWMKYVAVASIASSELRMFHAMLKERSRFILTRMNGVVRNYNQMLHHSNPACRAARTFPELGAARLLISLNDSDLPVHIWRDQRMSATNGLGVVAQVLLSVLLSPMLVLPVVTHEFVIEVVTTTLLNCAAVGVLLLGRVNVYIPIAIAASAAAFVVVSLLVVWHLEAAAHAKVAIAVTSDAPDEMLDELDQPIDGHHAATTAVAADAVKEFHAMLEAEEFTLLMDSRYGVSVKNHLKSKAENYDKLIRKYKLRNERAALATPEEDESVQPQPLFDTAPGDIITPFKVRPYDALSPRSPPEPETKEGEARVAEQEQPDDSLPNLKDLQKLQLPPLKEDRYVPRHVRREQELSKRRSEERKEKEAESVAFEFEFTNPMKEDAGSDEDTWDAPVRWGADARNKVKKPPAPLPAYDVASVTALLLQHNINEAVTVVKPTEKPEAHLLRVPKQFQRQRAADKAVQEMRQAEEQKQIDDSFSITYGDSDEEGGDGERKTREATEAAHPPPSDIGMSKLSAAVASAQAVSKMGRNLRAIRKEQQRARQAEAQKAEEAHMKAAEEAFDINELLFGENDEQAAASHASASAGAEERKVGDQAAVERLYHSQQKKQVQRPKSSSAARSLASGSPAADSAVSRAAALDAAHRAENIHRLNRIIAMNNFVNTTSRLAGKVEKLPQADSPAPVTEPISPATRVPQHSRRRDTHRLREEQDRKRQEEEQADWQMLNDDLFEDAVSETDD
jgi:hypothetical protein